jgi:5-methylcytosine-specific restriction endonuclease McrA
MSGVDVFEKETTDHLQPKDKNGILSKKNKVRACFKCNQLKGNMTVEEFLTFIESYIKILKMNWKRETNYAYKVKKSLTELIKQKRT